MKKMSEMFNKFTKSVMILLDIAILAAICCQVYAILGSWILSIISFAVLEIMHTVVIVMFFVKEPTLNENKLNEYVDNAQPWMLLLDTAICIALSYI